jgi:hypothetical protein
MRAVNALCVVLVLVFCSTAFGFDGKRKGFVLGGGLGVAPVAKWDSDIDGFDESKVAASGNLFLSSDYGDATITQGFGGASWYHYFAPPGKGFYTVVGLGAFNFDFEISGSSGSNDPGVGILAGGGYEFARHFQAGVYLSWGKTTEPSVDYTHLNVSIAVNAVAF